MHTVLHLQMSPSRAQVNALQLVHLAVRVFTRCWDDTSIDHTVSLHSLLLFALTSNSPCNTPWVFRIKFPLRKIIDGTCSFIGTLERANQRKYLVFFNFLWRLFGLRFPSPIVRVYDNFLAFWKLISWVLTRFADLYSPLHRLLDISLFWVSEQVLRFGPFGLALVCVLFLALKQKNHCN